MLLKHQEAVEASKKQLAESGQGSFIENKPPAAEGEAFFATPSPDKKKRNGEPSSDVVDNDLIDEPADGLNELEAFETFDYKQSLNDDEFVGFGRNSNESD